MNFRAAQFLLLNLLLFYSAAPAYGQGGEARDPETQRIVDEQNREAEIQGAAWERARRANNPRLCDLAAGLRDMCYREFAINRKSPELCNAIAAGPNPSAELKYQAALCLTAYGEDLKEPTVCNRIRDVDLKTRCITGATDIVTPEQCNYYVNPESRFSCMLNLAISTRDVELCSRVPASSPEEAERPDQNPTDFCIYSIATALRQIALCQRPQSTLMRDACRKQIAFDTSNPKICPTLEMEKYQEECARMFDK